MKHVFIVFIEQDEDWFIAWCPEVPGANGQGRTREECKRSLSEAIQLNLQDRLEDGLRGAPEEAERDVVTIE